MSDAILVAIVLLPLAIAYILKSSATLGFLALCTGYAVQSLIGDHAKNLLNTTNSFFITIDTVNLLLIMLPPALTFILCRGPSSRNLASPKVFLNLIEAVATGATFALMTVPYYSHIGSANIISSKTWHYLNNAKPEIVGFGALLALIIIWLGHRKSHAKHHK